MKWINYRWWSVLRRAASIEGDLCLQCCLHIEWIQRFSRLWTVFFFSTLNDSLWNESGSAKCKIEGGQLTTYSIPWPLCHFGWSWSRRLHWWPLPSPHCASDHRWSFGTLRPTVDSCLIQEISLKVVHSSLLVLVVIPWVSFTRFYFDCNFIFFYYS